VRGIRSRAVGWLLAVVLVLLLAGLAVLGLGVPGPWAAAAVVAAVLWMLVMPLGEPPRRAEPPLWPVPVLLVLVAAALLVDRSAPTGWLANAIAASALPAAPTQLLAGLAVVLVLTRTANLVVRAALGFARAGGDGDVAAEDGRRWVLRLAGRPVGSVEPARTAAPNGLQLLGGRVIGPLERLLFVALFLLGAHPVIVALLAAKGIVRFPEISADRGRGSKAEEFLIGSLTSWSLAVGGILFMAVSV